MSSEVQLALRTMADRADGLTSASEDRISPPLIHVYPSAGDAASPETPAIVWVGTDVCQIETGGTDNVVTAVPDVIEAYSELEIRPGAPHDQQYDIEGTEPLNPAALSTLTVELIERIFGTTDHETEVEWDDIDHGERLSAESFINKYAPSDCDSTGDID